MQNPYTFEARHLYSVEVSCVLFIRSVRSIDCVTCNCLVWLTYLKILIKKNVRIDRLFLVHRSIVTSSYTPIIFER
jgi:hypothetical protein